MRLLRTIGCATALGLGAGVVQAAAAVTLLGPSPYLSFADSPFDGLGFATFQLEDFENGALDTIGATTSTPGVIISPSALTDSVDADDGAIDGSGTGGRSMLAVGITAMAFNFDALALGALPTHVGIVWTDVGETTGPAFGVGDVEFEVFDGSNTSLGSIVGTALGDGSVAGGTAEDRFFGAISAGGIGRIEIRMPTSGDWEVDHLQYGVVPLPAAAWLFGAGLAALSSRRR
jgi:hypothetical protein